MSERKRVWVSPGTIQTEHTYKKDSYIPKG